MFTRFIRKKLKQVFYTSSFSTVLHIIEDKIS